MGKVVRYRSAACVEGLAELARARERLTVASEAAWQQFLVRFDTSYAALRNAVSSLAALDALIALADSNAWF
jgi:DNA mismatch repair ATPase MutS